LAGKRAVEERGVSDVAEVRAAMTVVAQREELFDLDYAEVVDPGTLSVPPKVGAEVRLLIAGRTGKARLIDNLAANRQED
jgi:pantothenate synthetase